ncbi:MAG TPA: low-specificity L-threonine aldolase [Polyangia bacterium]
MTTGPIDLRSDTVTKPSPGMRQAMAAAEVGDDVFAEDPTVRALEERAAALLGKEAALFVPSGTMANQIALKLHCQPGDEVIVGQGAHVYYYEAGAGAAFAGVQFAVVGDGAAGPVQDPVQEGRFTGGDVVAALKPVDNPHSAPTRLVCVENTHNRAGGVVWSPVQIADVAAAARQHGLALHLDGARLLNAAVALDLPASALAGPFDTTSLCFSKGLGAPVGSVLAGAREQMIRARRFRRMFGGGMRLAGVLAAAALYALDHNVVRLREDHENARRLADGLSGIPGLVVHATSIATNIVVASLDERHPAAAAVAVALREAGVLALALGPRTLRFVTHLDVSSEQCAAAAVIVRQVLRA